MSVADDLIERGAEVDEIRGALDHVVSGAGRAIAVLGPAGVGKTSLLRVARESAAERGTISLEAQACRLEHDNSFGVARELLERRVRTRDATARDRMLSGAARLGIRALSTFDDTDVDLPAIDPAVDSSYSLFHGLYWMVSNLSAEAPVLITVDDAQWADAASLRFLLYLTRRLADIPVLTVFGIRSGETGTESGLVAALLDQPTVTVLRPTGLSVAGTHALLDRYSAEHALVQAVDRLHDETGGNPFLLREVLRSQLGSDSLDESHGRLTAPESVMRSIVGRLDALGAKVAAFAHAVFILGDGCSVAEAGEVAGSSQGESARAAAALMRAEILADGDALRFEHPLVRTAVESQLTPVERAEWHARAARALMSRSSEPARVVAQLLNSAPLDDPEALRLLHRAGREAMSNGAPLAAERLLRRAIEEKGALSQAPGLTGALLADLGASLIVTDRNAEALLSLRQAYELGADDATLLKRTTLLARALFGARDVTGGIELLETTIEGFAGRNHEAVLMLESELATAAIFNPELLADTRNRLQRYGELLGQSPAERRLLSMYVHASASSTSDPAHRVAELARRAYADGQLLDENPLDSTKWGAIGAMILSDQLTDAEIALDKGQTIASTTGSIETFLTVSNLRGLLRLYQGRVAEAETELLDSLQRIREDGLTSSRRLHEVGMVRWTVLSMISRGRVADADGLLRLLGFDADVPPETRRTNVLAERGMLRLHQRRYRDALDDAERLADFHRSNRIEKAVDAPWRPVAALALAGLGRTGEAIEIADEHLRLVKEWGLPRDIGAALRTRAGIEPNLSLRLALLEEAYDAHRACPSPLELAKTEADLGTTLLRSGDQAQAKSVLIAALDRSARCGASALVQRVRAELRLAGLRPRRTPATGRESLTAAELRIAHLARRGLSNREIAQELFLSVRTAENTLRRVYQKLSITSRHELTAALGTESV